ncbi:hypothetical protein AXG93_2839s1050 [Marchantia polymorpha subsp. ruderalis]|uniref:Uncharacterized protein n=1 Tax=Marchantia polymorpha subsp. ruderalis TaxID=1480154 RepID=A0A176VDY1_MARPO|nr:hypothetical protein AXG93_2839s1050 [Marchantia polymorpha subsp. ruderalis]
MDLLTREEEKQFSREWEILTTESSEGTEDNTRQRSISPQTTALEPVQVDVVQRREKPKRRLAKRRKVVNDDEGDLALEVTRTEIEVDVIRQSRTRARPKKRANQGLVAAEMSDSSVEKTVASLVSTPEVAVGESTHSVNVEGPSGVLIEVVADAPAEPLKEGTEMLVAQVARTVVEAAYITLPSSPVEDLEETCGGLRISNENVQKVTVDLLARLEKFREAYDEAVKRSEQLIVTAEKRERNHVEEVAKLKTRRAEELRIAEELRGKIAEAKTAEEDLHCKISEIDGKCDAEFRRAEELSASLAEGVRKHEEELANWAKKLADCESAMSLEAECKLKFESECRRLRE